MEEKKPIMLIVGAGDPEVETKGDIRDHYDLVTLDIDPQWKPDILGDMLDIPVEDNTYDGVLCSHVLEHIHVSKLDVAIKEMYRVLKPGGEIYLSVPNLAYIAEKILEGKEIQTAYYSGFYAISPMDMLFGASFVKENPFFDHKYGFTRELLFKWFNREKWSFLVVHELRSHNEYDRGELRLYGIKYTENLKDIKLQSNWWPTNPDCGDPYVLKGGTEYVSDVSSESV